LYNGEEIQEEKKKEQKDKQKKYAYQEKNKIKVYDYNSKKNANEDVLSMNSEINKNKNIKSRNYENNDLFLYNEEYNDSSLNSKTPLKIFKTEFTKNENDNISYEKQKQILNLRLEGRTYEEIAQRVGYKTHSAVVKQMDKIGQKFETFAGVDYGFNERAQKRKASAKK
jgi:hypothetical protein